MKKNIIKYILFLLLIFNINNTFALSTENIVNLNLNQNDNYILEANKSLIIKKLDVSTWSIDLYDNSNIIYNWEWFNLNEWYIIINSNIEYIWEVWSNINIMWVIINKEDDVTSIINNTNDWINKNIFTKEDINFIYFWEFVIMMLWSIIVFLFRTLLWNRSFLFKFW